MINLNSNRKIDNTEESLILIRGKIQENNELIKILIDTGFEGSLLNHNHNVIESFKRTYLKVP